MRVTFWGTRGSLPTPMNTQEFRIKAKRLLMNARNIDLSDEAAVDAYMENSTLPNAMTFGGNTPCVEVSENNEHVILDCGSGLRVLGNHMMETGFKTGDRINILQTHTHWDHIMGFPFFSPALSGKADIHIYGIHPDLKERFDQQMDRIHFPITMDEMSADITFHQINSGEQISIGSFNRIGENVVVSSSAASLSPIRVSIIPAAHMHIELLHRINVWSSLQTANTTT